MSHHEALQLFDYQEAILGKLRHGFINGHRCQMLVAPTGAGKCLGRDTPVLMADGVVKAVQDVRPGDRLLGPDGNVRNVLSVTAGIGPLYRVTPTKGSAYVVNDAHILSLRKTPGSDGMTLADGERVRKDADVVNVNVETFARSNATVRHGLKGWRSDAVEFHAEPGDDLLLDPYWLGCWLGDGRSDHPTLCSPMCGMVEWWIEHAESVNHRVTQYRYREGECPAWGVASNNGRFNIFTNALTAYGLINNKHVPQAYKSASIADRLKVIAGLLDADGHLDHHGGFDFIAKDERLAQDMAFLCRSVGLAAYVSASIKTIMSIGFSGTYWRVSITGDVDRIPCIDKRAGKRRQKKRHLVHGVTVEPIGEGDYYGFTLDGDKLFLLGDFTVTHNTEMAMELLEASSLKGNRAAMVLDRIVLCNQTSERLDKYGMDHGVLQAGHWRYRTDKLIQVCSAQTLERRGSFPDLRLLIVDEAHQTRRQTIEFIRNNPRVKVVGLSATPFTKGLGRVYTNVVSAISTGELVERGRLAPLRVYIAKEIDMSGAKKVAGEWSSGEAESRGMQITGDVVSEWAKKTMEVFGRPRKTIVFASGVAHAADLAQKFSEAGYNFISLSYKDDDDFKADVIKDFGRPDTEIHGLIATDILTKGFDVPDVMIGVSARPFSKSLSSHVQQMGRVMRSCPGKEFAVWLDHSGNYLRFKEEWDRVYAEGVNELDDGMEKPKRELTANEKEAAKCPSCGRLWPSHADSCPSCGFVRARRNEVVAVPGELVELGGNVRSLNDRQIRQDWYSQLLHIAQTESYKKGWAANKYREKFGAWPPRNLVPAPIQVTPEVAKWVKSRQIAWAKARRAA